MRERCCIYITARGGLGSTVRLRRIGSCSRRDQRTRSGEDRSTRTLRQVGLGAQILSDLGIRKIRLLTNTPTHVPALQGFGIEIVEQVGIETGKKAGLF